MKYVHCFLICTLFLKGFVTRSQEIPPIQSFFPKDYNGETQNWGITQTENKFIYVANNKGLLEYNGATWELYTAPKNAIIRSVHAVNKRIYTGSYMNFGFWEKNATGRLQYTSLSDQLRENLIEDEQFWKILHVEKYVIFQSLDRIYIYNQDNATFAIIESNNTILNIFKINSEIYYQELDRGIFTVKGNTATLVAELSEFKGKNIKVVNLIKNADSFYLVTNSLGIYSYKNNTLSKWKIPANETMDKLDIYSSIQTDKGDFLLGTISNGLLVISPTGKIKYQIDQSSSLNNNTVLSMFQDIDHNIWLGLDNGINCINSNSPIRIFNDTQGNIGTVYTSAIYKNNLYLGTNQGLFRKKLGTNNPFMFVKGTKGQVWELFTYQDTLFCGHNNGTYILIGDKLEHISKDAGTWIFRSIKNQPDLLLQGTYFGLSILQKINGKWTFRNKISGFYYSARSIEFFKDKLWINHEYKGVFSLKFDKDFTRVTELYKDAVTGKSKNSNLVTFNNELLYAYNDGILKYHSKQDKFELIKGLDTLFTKETYTTGKLIKDNSDKLWSFSKEGMHIIMQSQFSSQYKIQSILIPKDLRKEMVGYESIMNLERNKYLIGRANGYLILDIDEIQNSADTKVYLNKVAVKTKEQNFRELDLSGEIEPLSSAANTISFDYSTPEFNKYNTFKFKYKLEGYYEQWSDWTDKTNITFENLPPGTYNFFVKNNKKVSDSLLFSFEIKKPWYQSTAAILVYILIVSILFILIHRTYKKYYYKQKQKLIIENEKKIALKKLESDQEIMRLSNEKLNQEIENKNKELASSTMSIIRKNEILNTIKKELQKIKNDRSNLSSVERIIDKNIRNEDDWKHFQEAFNNTDKDFLRELKNKHANLTPHDLRFCTYLRLNLSSKEIAPLLNISVRSVEIKRYRLRKKLSLEHSENLVSYIMQI